MDGCKPARGLGRICRDGRRESPLGSLLRPALVRRRPVGRANALRDRCERHDHWEIYVLRSGPAVHGELAETGDDGDGSDLTRSFMWRDKYGYGQLIVTFTPDFSEFDGKWNAGGSEFLPWNGRRCHQTIS